MPHIFVLYEESDHAFARQLAVQIEQRGMIVWPVPDQDQPSTDPESDPAIGLEHASHVLGILSPASVASGELAQQCQQALSNGKDVLGILYQPCDLPDHFENCPVVNFQGQFLLAVEELIQHLNRTHAPTRPLTVEYPPPVIKDLLPIMLPAERCWREDRLRINYTLPIVLPNEELALRLPSFLIKTGFELISDDLPQLHARRKRRYPLFDPRRAEHTLSIDQQEGSLIAYYKMTRTQVYHWFPAHYRVLDRESAALYRHLVTGNAEHNLADVDRQARGAQLVSWGTIGLSILIVLLLGYFLILV